MQITYDVFPDKKIVFTCVKGKITFEVLRDFAQSLENDERIDFPHFELVDLTDLIDFELSNNSYNAILHQLENYHHKKQRIGCIHIGGTPYAFWMGRMFEALWESAGYLSYTVKSYDEAMEIVNNKFKKK